MLLTGKLQQHRLLEGMVGYIPGSAGLGMGSGLSPRTGNVMEQELIAQGKGNSSFNREGEKMLKCSALSLSP